MTVSSEVTVGGPYTATASQTEFGFDFYAQAAGDITVLVNGSVNTAYSIAFNANNLGGTVTFDSGRTAGDIVLILLDFENYQATVFANAGFSSAQASALQLFADRVHQNIQQVKRQTLKFRLKNLWEDGTGFDVASVAGKGGQVLALGEDLQSVEFVEPDNASSTAVTPTGADGSRTLANIMADEINALYDWGDGACVPDCVVSADRTSATGTDNGPRLQAAFDAAGDGDTVRIPPGKYLIETAVSVDLSTKSINVIAEGALFFVAANVAAFTFDCGIAEVKALSGNYTKGSTSLAVAAMSKALAKGEPFKIVSNAVDPANRDEGSSANQYRVAEWAHAASATTTAITLQQALRFPVGVSPTSSGGDEGDVDAYTTTMNARVVRFNGTTIRWRGGTIEYEEGHDATPWTASALVIKGAMRPKIENILIARGYNHGVHVLGCYCPDVVAADVAYLTSNPSNSQYGYGVADASYATKVRGCTFKFARHGYTTTELTSAADTTNADRLLGSGRVVGFEVCDCSGFGGSEAPFDSHHAAEDGVFRDLTIEGVNGYAMSLRGRNVSADGITIRNCLAGVLVQTEYDSGDTDDDLWTSGKPEGLTSARLSNLDIHCTNAPLTVTNARRVLVTGRFEAWSAQHQCIINEGSHVLFGAQGRFLVTTFDGAQTISCITAVGVFDVNNADASLSSDEPSKITFLRSCDMELDLSDAADASNALRVFSIESASSMEFRGRISMTLPTGEFASVFGGTLAGFSAAPESQMVIAIDGAADNSQVTGLSSFTAKFEFADGSGWADTTGLAARELKPIWHDNTLGVTHTGTGSAVDSVVVLPAGPIALMDSDGQVLRAVLTGRKTGTGATAQIDFKWGAADNFSFALPNTACDWRVEMTAYMTGNDTQIIVFETMHAATGGGSPTRTFGQVAETVNLAAATQNWRAQCTANAADTIVFETAQLWGTKSVYAVS